MSAPQLSSALAPSVVLPKPTLRGVSHEVFAAIVVVGAGIFVHAAIGARARVACGIYAASLAVLFAVSALYHRPQWNPEARQWMRRLDHSAIFVLIAGSYTPFCLILEGHGGRTLFVIIWGCAALGVARALFWVQAPKILVAILALGMGWVVLGYMRDLYAVIGLAPLVWVGAGGIAYTAGALVYALKKPDPWPRSFGYHEVFHAFVIIAALLQFRGIVMALEGAGLM